MSSPSSPSLDLFAPRHLRGSVPLRLFARAPLPVELVEAIAEALAAEEREENQVDRMAVALRTRGALDAWLDGTLSTEETVRALHHVQGNNVRFLR
ncbi:MAG: hypothetical protein ACRELB_19885 [Polyangiaceae bacterium]